jgi:diacylglycerol kinase (ATP)
MTAFSHVCIIYNPNSTGDAQSNAEAFAKKLRKQAGFSATVELVETEHAGHAGKLAARYSAMHKQCLIISSSGDGGYHDVINGVLASSKSRNAAVGLLPSGNANDHYHAVHQPNVVSRIASGSTTAIDIMKITMTSHSKRKVYYAHSYAGIGLTPHVGKRLNQTQLNRFNEIFLVMHGLWMHRAVKITVGGKNLRYESLIFSTISHMSKVLNLSKKSSIHDGLFEINGITKTRLPGLLNHLVRASTIGLDEETHASDFEFICRQKLDVQIDGEIYSCDKGMKLRIDCMKNALKTII